MVALVTQPDRVRGRRGSPQPPAAKREAEALEIPVLQPRSIRTRDFRREVKQSGAEAGVVVAYGKILGPRLLQSLPLGFINVHASLLPRWRGASPIQAAIRAGDARSGVTIMQMDAGLDTGDLLIWEELALHPRETAGSLHDRLAAAAGDLLPRALTILETGQSTPLPQAESPFGPPTTCGVLHKADGQVDWTLGARELDRHVRAMVPWPGAFTTLREERILLLEAEPADEGGKTPGEVLQAQGASLLVACGEGSLALRRLQRAGRRPADVREFLRGFPVQPGELLA